MAKDINHELKEIACMERFLTESQEFKDRSETYKKLHRHFFERINKVLDVLHGDINNV